MSSIDERIQWFQDARFGLFIHWGLYSLLAGEWQGQRMDYINDWDFPDYDAKNYALYFEKKVKPQVRELLTNYGPICLLWFDCPVSLSREQSLDLYNLVRELQPGCLVNSRLGNGLGDYGSLGDNQVPSSQPSGNWETPATLNDTWGYKFFDHSWKSAPETLGVLAGLASKNVNYLLNIGPQPNGRFPDEAVKVLTEIGDWMEVYGEAIHTTRQSPFPYDFDWGWITQRPGGEGRLARLYLLFKDWPQESFTLRGLRLPGAPGPGAGHPGKVPVVRAAPQPRSRSRRAPPAPAG